MKRAIISLILLSVVACVLASCGGNYGSSSSSSTNPTSKIKTRAFVSNSFTGSLNLVDYSKDLLTASTIPVANTPEFMTVSKDRTLTAVFDSGNNSMTLVNNSTETATATVSLGAFTESFIISADDKSAWAAVRNNPVSNAQPGTIEVINIANSAVGTAVPVPLVRHIFVNHAGTAMIALSDAAAFVANPLTILDVTTPLTPAIKTSLPAGANLDRPIWAVFSADDSKAYIVNCGPECGGTVASVSVLDMPSATITSSFTGDGTHPMVGSIALLDSNNLYVAGTTTAGVGQLWALNASGGTVTLNKGPIQIGDGFHTTMELASSNKLFVGANPCSNAVTAPSAPPQGCLTIYDTGAGTAVVDQAKGFVTGMAPVPRRNVVYVIEGGELNIYDTTTSAIFKDRFIDIVGQAFDVKVIDP